MKPVFSVSRDAKGFRSGALALCQITFEPHNNIASAPRCVAANQKNSLYKITRQSYNSPTSVQ